MSDDVLKELMKANTRQSKEIAELQALLTNQQLVIRKIARELEQYQRTFLKLEKVINSNAEAVKAHGKSIVEIKNAIKPRRR